MPLELLIGKRDKKEIIKIINFNKKGANCYSPPTNK